MSFRAAHKAAFAADGAKLTFTVYFVAALAQALKELTAPAGFDLDLKGSTRDVYLSQYWMNGPMLLTGWGPRVDPSMLLKLAYRSDGPWNESHMNDPEIDALIDKMSLEIAYVDLGAVEDAGGQCTVDARLLKRVREMLHCTGSA